MSEEVEEPQVEETNLGIVMICKEECLDCKFLLPQLRDTEYPCYGERNCPAVTYRITIGVDIKAYSDGLAEAWLNGDTTTIGKITARLEQIDPAVKSKVMQLARSKMGVRNG